MTPSPSSTGEDPFGDQIRTGEHLEEVLQIGAATVGVTDQRLLVRQDDRIRAVDLTNVRAVRHRTIDEKPRLARAAQWTVVALVLLGGWLFAPLDGMTEPIDPPQGTGFDGPFDTVNQLVSVLGYLDEAFLLGGLLAVLPVGGFLLLYVRSREQVLEVTVAGMDPIRLPPPRDTTAVDRLRGAVTARAGPDTE